MDRKPEQQKSNMKVHRLKKLSNHSAATVDSTSSDEENGDKTNQVTELPPLKINNQPQQIKSKNDKYTLCLDMDETLVHYDYDSRTLRIRPHAD